MTAVNNNSLKLFLLGFLTLFLELILIRYLSGNIWNLGYFPNLVLLAVFVGMGSGFVFHHRLSPKSSDRIFQIAIFLLVALVAFLYWKRPAVPGFGRALGEVGGEIFYTATPVKQQEISWLIFALWFFFIVLIFAFISQRTAKLFSLFPPLKAYTLDISGSCTGILTFMLMSWLHTPAWIWFLALIPLFVAVQNNLKSKLAVLPLLGLIAWVAWIQDSKLLSDPNFAGTMEVHWSPYQKVEYTFDTKTPHQIFVNGVYHQNMNNAEEIRRAFYSSPYGERKKQNLPAYKNVLIIGSGSGNDVAAALMNGVEHVDAVEIDPLIAMLGKKHHPAKPYDDSRVRLIIDDARSFMTNTQNRYDLIVFALTDSLVKVSPMSQLRLENYIYTTDSIRRAYSLLSDNGDLLFYNQYRKQWLIEKLQIMIHDATGKYAKTIIQRYAFAVLLVGKHVEANFSLTTDQIDSATDDWPFPYLKVKGIPDIYIGAISTLAILSIILLILVQRTSRAVSSSENLPLKLAFFFMGTAFLLLETKSVIQFSLLFGTTWINNSLVFLGILVLVLIANWTATLFENSGRVLWIAYALLLVFCAAAFIFPLSGLLKIQQPWLRFIFASIFTFSPIYFANLIFSVTFRNQPVAEHLFGWNLIGATAGGALEYTSMAFGYNMLAAVVAICYTIVFLLLLVQSKKPLPT
jgi:hypothetical protein